MIKTIIALGEWDQNFSLFLTEKDGRPIIIVELFNHQLNETEVERNRPMFGIVELRDTPSQSDLESFVQAVKDGNQDSHPLSINFRINRSNDRGREIDETSK
jgi:hypothetical protein